MAKVSPVSIKYMIKAAFRSEGPLEKPDVIGAIFGQTEGLLGSDLEMRELQKEGRIGRIEVELEIVDGKSVGEIQIPTALDKTETTLIAAALETIDKIGPTEAHIEIINIEDVRGNKRDYIMDRAKKLLEKIESGDSFKEMSDSLKEESRVAKIQEYGENKLPCGDISGKEIIVVEGRADVVNLLKNRVNNVIGMNGTKLPSEIAELGEKKEITLFVDGDRGGKLIAQNVINNANISFVAVAPDGKEVEELVGKEILIALRKRMPVKDYLRQKDFTNGSNNFQSEKETEFEFRGDVKERLKEVYEDIKGSRGAVILDSNLDIIRKISSRDLTKAIRSSSQRVAAVVLEGNVNYPIISACEERGVSYLAATTFSVSGNTKVKLISL